MRDGTCIEICPVEAIVLGNPKNKYPWAYIDPEVCVDCTKCQSECAYEAIFYIDDIPSAYKFDGNTSYVPHDSGQKFSPLAGTVIDLRNAARLNAEFFESGPGYG